MPEARFMCSEEVHASVASTHEKVLSVAPLSVSPPPSAPASVGDVTAPRTMFLSSIVISVELIVVVVPLTVRSPERTKDVPVAAPIFGVTSVGVLAKTSAPVPVSSEITPASSDDEVAAKALNLLFVRATVPVASGKVTVRSAVGSVTVSVVSKASAVAPSRTIEPSESVRPETVGLVIVLFVSVCVSVVPTIAPVTPCVAVRFACVETYPEAVDSAFVCAVPAAPYASYVFAVTDTAPVVSLYERPVPTLLPIASCALSVVK